MKYCIVAPYRNREQHLIKWIDHYKDLGVDLYVIEQDDDKPFNRGKLFNAFYLIQGNRYLYTIYHDVDMRVDMKLGDINQIFDFPINPTLIATYVQQFNGSRRDTRTWKEVYDTYFGGITALTRNQMVKCGGYSNDIWSWGNEDDALRKSVLDSGMSIDRRKAYVWCEQHERAIDPINFNKGREIVKNGVNLTKDGLEFCTFEVTERVENEFYTHIKVKL